MWTYFLIESNEIPITDENIQRLQEASNDVSVPAMDLIRSWQRQNDPSVNSRISP